MHNGAVENGTTLFERALWQETREAFLQHRGRRRAVDPQEAAQLAAYIRSEDCTADIENLSAQVFDFPPPRQLKLRKSHSNRRRTLYVYPKRQNMLMKYIDWMLHVYDPIFSNNLYSFRLNRSTVDLFRRLVRSDGGRRFWVVKADVRNYGHSINPDLLISQLRRIVGDEDPALMAFFEYLLTRREFLHGDKIVTGCMGGLPGVPISTFFNNVYLMQLDAAMGEKTVLCSRYADDIALFTRSRDEALNALEEMRAIMDELTLSLNEDKTQVLAPGECFELLGIQVCGADLDVASTTISKAKFKLGNYARKLVLKEQREGLGRDEAALKMVDKAHKYFYGDRCNEHELSWRNFFFRLITRPDSLREMDHYVQGLIRYVATGKRSNARYRFRYKDMEKLGYRPLVSDYYRYRSEIAKAAGEMGSEL